MSGVEEEGQVKDRFSLIKRMLRICGVSFRRKETFFYKIYSSFVLFLNCYPLFQLIGVNRYLENGDEILDFSVFEIVTLLILIKATVLVNHRFSMGDLLEKLQNGMFAPDAERGGEREEILLNECVTLTDRQAKAYWIIVTVTVIFAPFHSTYSRLSSDDYHDWKFEYSRVTMFNTSYSPNYEIASWYQNLSWFPMGWMFSVSDLLTVTVMAHITCQLKILQNSIKRIMFNSYKRMMKDKYGGQEQLTEGEIDASKIPWKYIKTTLIETTEYHLGIIDICYQIENSFNLLVLVIVLSGIALLGGLLYRPTFVHVGGVFCILCEIILISYWGNEVSLESQNVLQACYEVNFFGADIRFQKGLFIVMERCKRPITFTAGKFSPLTLGTFLWIARASYSYLMILRRVNN